MPIRVVCPSCGRVGHVPDNAVGLTLKCPMCSHKHRLTADRGLTEEEAAPPTPTAQPRPGSVDAVYELEERPVEPPKRPVRPAPVGPVHGADEDALDAGGGRDRPGGLPLPMPAMVGGALGLVLLAGLGIGIIVGMSRGRDPAAPVAAAPVAAAPVAGEVDSSPKSPANPVTTAAPVPAPQPPASSVAAAAPLPASQPPASPVAAAVPVPTPGPKSAPDAPANPVSSAPDAMAQAAPAAPGEISVVDAMQTTDIIAPEPEGDSALAAHARAAAATVASRDEGAGKTLSTADIVAESEPSVALVKGKVSSGSGFLVAPGLLATNAHVIDDEFVPDVDVRFVSADERHNLPQKAELLYEDPERDLAFLAVQTDLKPLRIARTYAFRKGEDITVIGNPGMGDGQVLENAISRGVMSTKTQLKGQSFYQLGIAVNPGNSGGPVFDSSGRAIGVVTLKSSQQEATSFSIPIEDVNAALTRLAQQSAGDAHRYRSRHRVNTAVKGLGSGGALICLIVDLRRIGSTTNNPAVKEVLGKLEPIVAELDQELFPSLVAHAPRVERDPLVATSIKDKVGDLAENFDRLRDLYSAGGNVDNNRLRPLKQTHKRLLTELSASLKLEVPPGLMVAFDEHAPSQQTIITMAPQGLGLYGSRLRHRSSIGGPGVRGTPGGIARPPSLHDRLRRGSRR